MKAKPALYIDNGAEAAKSDKPAGRATGLARWIGGVFLHEFREVMPPTIFFFLGFNLIVLTTNLLLAQYLVAFSNFMLATTAALIVGKAVLVANKLPFLRRYDRAPLILPILFKTAVYWIIVFLARMLEHLVRFSLIEHNPVSDFLPHMIATFSWHRFIAISLWILVLFMIYVTASEFSQLFGRGEIRRLLFTHRPSDLQLNRKQRIRELLRLSRLADAYSADHFRDPNSAAHQQLIDIVQRLSRPNERTI